MAKTKLSLLPGETILLVTRPSELLLLPPALIVLVAIYLPWYFLIKYGLAENYSWYMIIWTAAVSVYSLVRFIEWLRSQIIITSKRLVVVRNRGLLGRQQQELDLRYIQNVTLNTAGIIGMLGRISDLEVQGANPADKIVLKGVGHPHEVKDLLWQRHSSSSQT